MSEHEYLSEKEVKKLRQEKALRPYKKSAVRFGRVAARIGGGIVGGLNYLGREGQKSRKPYREAPIDLGFGPPKKQSRPSSFESKLRSTLSTARKIRVVKEKRRVKRKRASINRFS